MRPPDERKRAYKRLARLAAWTGFGAALIGSLVLMLVHWLGPGGVLSAAAGTQAVLLLVSLGTSLVIGRMQPFEAWMLKRADAENFRGELFDKVMAERATAAPGTVPLLAQQLEYSRRHLLDVERKYYRERGEQHAAAARAGLVVAARRIPTDRSCGLSVGVEHQECGVAPSRARRYHGPHAEPERAGAAHLSGHRHHRRVPAGPARRLRGDVAR